MERLIEYSGHHPLAMAYVVLALLAVVFYELRMRAQEAGAVSPQDAVRLINQGAAVLDVREAEAFKQGHTSGARQFDRSDVQRAADQLKRFKERPLIVYCERGISAAPVVRALSEQGFSKVVNLRGGISAWRAESLPLTRE